MLLELLNEDVLPVIPEQGSVGASGDLAPLAHLALVLIGEGEATREGVDARQRLPSCARSVARRSSRRPRKGLRS